MGFGLPFYFHTPLLFGLVKEVYKTPPPPGVCLGAHLLGGKGKG